MAARNGDAKNIHGSLANIGMVTVTVTVIQDTDVRPSIVSSCLVWVYINDYLIDPIQPGLI